MCTTHLTVRLCFKSLYSFQNPISANVHINALHFCCCVFPPDFAFIHEKFLAPLPPTTNEFSSSLLSVFPHILDVNHLMKELGLFDKMNNLSSAISYLDSRFSASVDMEVSYEGRYSSTSNHILNSKVFPIIYLS